MSSRTRGLAALLVIGAMQACGGGNTTTDAAKIDGPKVDAPVAATAMAACMHICLCEANAPGTPGTTDAMCQADCQQSEGPFTSTSTGTSTSTSTSTSLSTGTSFSTTAGGVDFAASEQACVACFAAASCSGIVAGTVCASDCQ